MRHGNRILAWLTLIAVCSGCGGLPTGTVSGTVAVDGKPLAAGTISYVPADSQGQPISANVVAGKYSLQTTAGKKTVQISAPIVVERRKQYDAPDAPIDEITEESIPPRYNTESTLTFEVKPGSNTKDWAVESIAAGSGT